MMTYTWSPYFTLRKVLKLLNQTLIKSRNGITFLNLELFTFETDKLLKMGNVFETCSISKKASRNISEPELLQDTGMREKIIEPEAALETHTGMFKYNASYKRGYIQRFLVTLRHILYTNFLKNQSQFR